ncbi:olfactory receptor 10G7-like [Ambystoma mexicanum]|uniref:olfactory receptor 10G7-like n=1 Tax=Ambystoma mexicanum TaxID=8296 RepID=UPI0037E75630
MVSQNVSRLTEFVLLGFPHRKEMSGFLFFVFSLFYLSTLLGNLLLIQTIMREPQLHAPMYFFLLNLSFLDVFLSSVTQPKLLFNLLASSKIISFEGCMAQLYFFHFLASTECFLYTIMAFDRYVAICKPLQYINIMKRKVCVRLAVLTWLSGSLHALTHTMLTFRLPFCHSNLIPHFFCDIPPLLKLVCTDTSTNEVVILTNIGVVALGCFLLILISYVHIFHAILQIRNVQGKQKAFSTCTAHITAVTMYFGPPVFIYIRPTSVYSIDRSIAVFYTVVTPMLNPIIYSLRNKDVKTTLQKYLCGNKSL